MSVSYVAVLAIPERTVFAVENWLGQRRRELGTRWRALTCMEQAVLVVRWFIDGTRVEQLALDNAIGSSTAYDALHEAIEVIAARAPSLHGALLAAKAAGYEHIDVDGMLVHTDRSSEPGPAPPQPRSSGPQRARVDLWWSPKISLSRRQRAGRDRSGRMAAVGVGRDAGPNARHPRRARQRLAEGIQGAATSKLVPVEDRCDRRGYSSVATPSTRQNDVGRDTPLLGKAQ